jgi:hypothetical protein
MVSERKVTFRGINREKEKKMGCGAKIFASYFEAIMVTFLCQFLGDKNDKLIQFYISTPIKNKTLFIFLIQYILSLHVQFLYYDKIK